MTFHYVKRLRMEIDLRRVDFSSSPLPPGYRWEPWLWSADFIERHAETKYHSFAEEIDSQVFPCLGERRGCLNLMQEISGRKTFLPESTWLIVTGEPGTDSFEDCATIQGLMAVGNMGAVQNVGVVPRHRRKGLGRHLVRKCLHGFQSAGLDRVYLEVTAENIGAVALYDSLGFRLVRTTYKAIEIPVR